MKNNEVVIIDYGAGNIRSVKFALERIGVNGILSRSISTIQSAEKIIFPGVGEASTAMKQLKESGLAELIPTLKQPLLGICLGMQLLCETIEEGNTIGLGVFKGAVKRFSTEVKVPHVGWNKLYEMGGPLFNTIPEEAYVYFVHSFYLPITKNTIASCDYGKPFSAALRHNNIYACQFHPEKSGSVGEEILKNFIKIKA